MCRGKGCHGECRNDRRDGDDLPDRKIEPARKKGQHLPHRDDSEVGRLPRYRDQVLTCQKSRRKSREHHKGYDKEKRQYADPHKEPLQDSAEARPAIRFVIHYARASSKKSASTRSCVICASFSSARSSPRYITWVRLVRCRISGKSDEISKMPPPLSQNS